MFFLFQGEEIFFVSDKHSYTVGRKNCDIELDEDASISRKHSTIYIAKKINCSFDVNTVTGVWIVDEQSKYGTYVKVDEEWEKIKSGEKIKLNHGNMIKFGLLDNIWR